MLSLDDVIVCPYSSDLTQAGVAYIQQALLTPTSLYSAADSQTLRQVVAEKGAELAFRRLLAEYQVPHQMVKNPSFFEQGTYQAAIGGRRCDIVCHLLCERKGIQRLQQQPGSLMQAAVTAAAEKDGSERPAKALYIFIFAAASLTLSMQDLHRVVGCGQPYALLYLLPEVWATALKWRPLQRLALENDSDETLSLTLGGLDGKRQALQIELHIPPYTRIAVEEELYVLRYLRAQSAPRAALALHSSAIGKRLLVASHQWHNLWLYGVRLYFAGYLAAAEYRRLVRRFPAGTLMAGGVPSRQEVHAVLVKQLRPLAHLFERARQWQQRNMNK